MDLSKFPLEVLEVLADFFSVEDLSACSAVSMSWRAAFNLDLFWRRHCKQEIVSYLKNGCRLLDPHFKELVNSESLQPLCDWRVHQMRQAHLLRNWRKGRYHMQKIQLQTPVINCTLGMDTTGNHWLIVNLGNRTEVWDVQTTPKYHATFGNLTGAPNYLEVVGEKLIVVDFYYFVRVFNLNLPSLGFVPSSMFFYTDSESQFIDLTNNDHVDTVLNRLRSCFRQGHVLSVMDSFLIGYCSYVESQNYAFLHIWNINTESKFCEETVSGALRYKLTTQSCSVYISSDNQSKQLLCSLYLFDKYISKLVLYSLKRKKFTDFCLTISGKVDWCDISGGLVATSHLLHQLHIYSWSSGNLVHILDTNTRMSFGPNTYLQYQMMGNYMIQPSRDSVKVINIQNHWDNLLLYFYSVYKVITIPPKFIAVSARPYLNSNKIILEVWNIREKIHVLDYTIAESECPAYHTVQPLLTKTAIAIGKIVKLLSFW